MLSSGQGKKQKWLMRNQPSTLKEEYASETFVLSMWRSQIIIHRHCVLLNGVNNRKRYIFALIHEMKPELFSPGNVEKL